MAGIPSCPEAERAILGAVLLDGLCDGSHQVREHFLALKPSDWTIDAHRMIHGAIVECLMTQGTADVIAVHAILKSKGQDTAVGGPAYLGHLYDVTPTTANISVHVAIVREASRKRAVIEAAQRIIDGSMEGCDTADAVASRGAEELVRLATVGASDLFRFVKSEKRLSDESPPVPSPIWGTVDVPIIVRGKVTIIHAREGLGKSWLAMGLARSVASGDGYFLEHPTDTCPVLLVSAELSDGETHHRATQIRGGLDPCDRYYVLTEEGIADFGGIDLLDGDCMAQLIRAVKVLKTDLVILDPLADLWGGKEDNQDFGRLIGALRKLRTATGAGILLLHHEPKPSTNTKGGGANEVGDQEALRGGTRLSGGVKSILRLREKQGRPVLVHWKSNLGRKADPIWLDLSDQSRPIVVPAPDDPSKRRDGNLECIAETIRGAKRPLSRGEVMELSGVTCSGPTLSGYLRDLVTRGAIVAEGRNPNTRYRAAE